MKILWSDSARADARAIVSFISKDDPRAAAKWIMKLNALIERLADFPYSGHEPCGEVADRLSEIRHGNYRVFYEVRKDTLFIARIWHGAR